MRILGCSTNFADITWIGSETADYNESKLNARRVDINGGSAWGSGTNSVILSQFVNEYSLAHTKISDGYVVFVLNKDWVDSYYHLYAQKVLFDGSVMWSSTGVFVSGEMGDVSASWPMARGFKAITLSETNIIVTWIGSFEMATAQAISKDGKIFWNSNLNLGLSNTWWEGTLKVNLCDSNKVIATWWDHKNWNTSKTNLIYAQRFDIFGNKEYGETALLIAETYADYDEANAEQCLFDDGKKLFYEWVYSNKIYRQTLDINSQTLGYPIQGLIVAEVNEPRILDCSSNPDNDVIRHFWSETSNVYCQFLDENEVTLNELHELPIALQAKNIYSISSVVLNNDNILAVWHDERNGPYDIFAQYVEAIPEPLLFFPLLLIGFFCKKRKSLLAIILFSLFCNISFAWYGAVNEPGNGWKNDKESKGRDWQPKLAAPGKNDDNFITQSYYDHVCRIEGGKSNSYYYLGMYNNECATYVELYKNVIEFGESADTINFNNMKMTNVRIPLTNEHNHAVNVQYVREYMDDSIGGLGDVKTRLSAAENSIIYISNNYVTIPVFNSSTNGLRSSINTNIIGIQNNKNEIIFVSNYLYYVVSPRTTNNAEKIADNLHFTDLNEQAIDNLETDLNNDYYEKGETDNAITNAISATRNEDNYWKGKTYFANEVTLSNSAANSPQLWLCAANGSKTKLEQKSNNFDLKSWLVSTNNAQIFTAIGPGGEHGELELYPQKARVTVPLNMDGNRILGLPISPFATNESDAVCVGYLDEKLDDFGGNIDDRLDDIEIDVLWCQTNIVSLWSNVNEFSQLQLISGDMSITQYMATTLHVQGKIDELNFDLSADIDGLQDQIDDIETDVGDLDDSLEEKLDLSGGIMDGDIDMGGNVIDDVGLLTVQELEFKGSGILNFTPGMGGEGVIQVDDDDVLLMTADNVTFDATLDIDDNRIINLDDMQDEDTESTDAASVGYVREFVAEYTGDKDWFTHRRNHVLAGGGKIDWICHDVDDYSLKWSEDFIIVPAGANGTVFKILAEEESPIEGIEPNTLFYVQPDDDEYQDGEVVELMVDADILSDYEPDPNDIIIGYAHSNGFFYLRDGRIIAANESNENGFDSRATKKIDFDNKMTEVDNEIDGNSGEIFNIKNEFSEHITAFSNSVNDLSQLVSNSEYYVSKTTTEQQAMAGGLTLDGKVIADDFYITGKPDLIMGNSGNPGTIYLFGEGMIEAPAAGGGNITLKAPNGSVKLLNSAICDDSLTVKKETVLEDDLQLPKLAGLIIIDRPKTADKINEYQIKNSLVKVSSVIIVTPLEEYEKIWVDRKVQGSFYINWRPQTREISFNYLIINTEGK